MRRINTSLKVTDKFGTDKHGWTDGGSPPTDSTSGEEGWFDHVQEEIANVVESGGYIIPENEVAENDDLMLAQMRIRDLAVVLSGRQENLALAVDINSIAGGIQASSDNHIFSIVGDGATVYQWKNGGVLLSATAPGSPTDIFHSVWSASNNQFVLVGNGGDAWTQPSAGTPTLQTTPTSNDLRTVAYDGTTYVAGGASGTIITSTNGVTWTSRMSNLSNLIRTIAHNGTTFLAVDDTATGDVSTSADGITWANQTVTGVPATASIVKVVWNAARSKWYAIAYNISGEPTLAQVMESTDGIAWATTQLIGDDTNQLDDIAVSSGGIMAVTDSPRLFVSDGRLPWQTIRFGDDLKIVGFVRNQLLGANEDDVYVCGDVL